MQKLIDQCIKYALNSAKNIKDYAKINFLQQYPKKIYKKKSISKRNKFLQPATYILKNYNEPSKRKIDIEMVEDSGDQIGMPYQSQNKQLGMHDKNLEDIYFKVKEEAKQDLEQLNKKIKNKTLVSESKMAKFYQKEAENYIKKELSEDERNLFNFKKEYLDLYQKMRKIQNEKIITHEFNVSKKHANDPNFKLHEYILDNAEKSKQFQDKIWKQMKNKYPNEFSKLESLKQQIYSLSQRLQNENKADVNK